MSERPKRWYQELNGYHWFVLAVCTLGWLFDCGDQQIFALARTPAMKTLLQSHSFGLTVEKGIGYATSVMLIGWATGGILFGIMGDRVGRAKTMVWTILCYSIFTGLGGLSQTAWEFLFFRFMTGLGVGGQFAVGVSLVAEVMPDRARAPALGLLQAFSATGNAAAALMTLGIGHLEHIGQIDAGTSWRWMFFIGVIPALLAVVVMTRLREPERWQKAVGQDDVHRKKAGSVAELFGTPRWRYNVIVGMMLATVGVIGLWGIGFFSIDLNRTIFLGIEEKVYREKDHVEQDKRFLQAIVHNPETLEQINGQVEPPNLLAVDAKNKDPRVLLGAMLALRKEEKPVSVESVLAFLDGETSDRKAQTAQERTRRAEYLGTAAPAGVDVPAEIARIKKRSGELEWVMNKWAAFTSVLFNLGAFFGVYVFSVVTQRLGRRPTFAIFFLAAFVATAATFLYMKSARDVLWMIPLLGFFQLSVFGGYAIYFPELFPTRLRNTGTSFCYNIARFVSALGPAALGYLASDVFGDYAQPMRPAGAAMSAIFLLGILVVYFAPETKDQPLPE
ncbi:MAG: MFS transporter [Pirellulales bacterium]|nr:MFS transporter [Pirellulales bacterium]